MRSSTFRGVAAGQQLGNLEYLIDEETVAGYRALAGDCAGFANILADDCVSMAVSRFGLSDLTTRWRRLDFLRPPITGRRIQVGGWLKAVEEREGLPWLRISAFAVDEIGTEILRSEAAFVVASADPPPSAVPGDRTGMASDEIAPGSAGRVGDAISLGSWAAPSGASLMRRRELGRHLSGTEPQADGHGDTALLAGWLEGRIGRLLGDDFRWGGRLSVGHRRPIAPGELLSAEAVVAAHDAKPDGQLAIRLIVGVRNGRNETVAVGEASAKSPSPRLV